MSTTLVKDARLLVTQDAQRREIEGGSLLIRDSTIEAVLLAGEIPPQTDKVIDATGMLVLPGLVNTHHHLYQTLTRAIPAVQNAPLFEWLKTLYPIWANLTGEAVYVSALVGLAELLLSGCTTSTDHLYIFPNDVTIDDEIRAGQELGIRFQPCRGSMSLGESEGGLPPDSVIEEEPRIIADCRRLIETYHDPNPCAMTRLVLAPCSPFSVTPQLMCETAELARSYGVPLHTHVAETKDEEEFCLAQVGKRPVAYMEELGWVGPDVFYAHGIYLNEEEISLLADVGTGVAHCPSSNMRLGSGIAPVREMLDTGAPVGIAADGSASNDGGHLLLEARMAMLLQRVRLGPQALTAREALDMATLGGAKLLCRDDIGSLEAGKAADVIGIRVDRLEYAGAQQDLLAAAFFCAPRQVDLSMVNGRVLVEDGRLLTIDVEQVVQRHNEIAEQLLGGE